MDSEAIQLVLHSEVLLKVLLDKELFNPDKVLELDSFFVEHKEFFDKIRAYLSSTQPFAAKKTNFKQCPDWIPHNIKELFKVVSVPSDGNCFFTAVSNSLIGTSSLMPLLRLAAVFELHFRAEYFSRFAEEMDKSILTSFYLSAGTLSKHAASARKSARKWSVYCGNFKLEEYFHWAVNGVILALACAIDRSIAIYLNEEYDTIVYFDPSSDHIRKFPIFLIKPGNHYEAMIPVNKLIKVERKPHSNVIAHMANEGFIYEYPLGGIFLLSNDKLFPVTKVATVPAPETRITTTIETECEKSDDSGSYISVELSEKDYNFEVKSVSPSSHSKAYKEKQMEVIKYLEALVPNTAVDSPLPEGISDIEPTPKKPKKVTFDFSNLSEDSNRIYFNFDANQNKEYHILAIIDEHTVHNSNNYWLEENEDKPSRGKWYQIVYDVKTTNNRPITLEEAKQAGLVYWIPKSQFEAREGGDANAMLDHYKYLKSMGNTNTPEEMFGKFFAFWKEINSSHLTARIVPQINCTPRKSFLPMFDENKDYSSFELVRRISKEFESKRDDFGILNGLDEMELITQILVNLNKLNNRRSYLIYEKLIGNNSFSKASLKKKRLNEKSASSYPLVGRMSPGSAGLEMKALLKSSEFGVIGLVGYATGLIGLTKTTFHSSLVFVKSTEDKSFYFFDPQGKVGSPTPTVIRQLREGMRLGKDSKIFQCFGQVNNNFKCLKDTLVFASLLMDGIDLLKYCNVIEDTKSYHN